MKKGKEAARRMAYEMAVDEILETLPQKFCANCGEDMSSNAGAFLEVHSVDPDVEAETVAVYCPKCIKIDGSRAKRVVPRPREN